MRTLLVGLLLAYANILCAQRCATSDYLDARVHDNAVLASRIGNIENFITHQLNVQKKEVGEDASVIRIPVVVHVVYHTQSENVSLAQIQSQLEILNNDFRRKNLDSINTPARFKAMAADTRIEFVLATADPIGRSTNGIVRKYTPVTAWSADDKIKLESQGGSAAWDAGSYLNIWVGNFKNMLGYSSALGCDKAVDGVAINRSAFGTIGLNPPYHLGRTAVHEVGHWLGLRHIWGDTYCGDDLVDDTPRQGNFTSGCPTGFRTSCSNGTQGDMFMNYMDFTNDACMNLFTIGQKQRMTALFATGGPRASLVTSRGLSSPWSSDAALPTDDPKSLTYSFFYPNPVASLLTMDFEADPTWVGKTLNLVNQNGAVVKRILIAAVRQQIGLPLTSGLYFIQGTNGTMKLNHKLIRL